MPGLGAAKLTAMLPLIKKDRRVVVSGAAMGKEIQEDEDHDVISCCLCVFCCSKRPVFHKSALLSN